MSPENIHALEKRAMVLDRWAILELISAFHLLRQAAQELLDARYRDGYIDAVSLSRFEASLEACWQEEAE